MISRNAFQTALKPFLSGLLFTFLLGALLIISILLLLLAVY